ncbi:MAG TPA: preprotein translocase subunit SecE [Solirubrobacteraceae bacterium]|nr:preprotein translocase subunit SecE [Solirubrobacteraceae bacterium]
MARDRKRAKQRRARRGPAPAGRGSERAPERDGAEHDTEHASTTATDGGAIQRADLPGALEHAGDVDEFDAALVMGAGGVAAAPDAAAQAELEAEAELAAEAALQAGAQAEPGTEHDTDTDLGADLLQTEAGGAGGAGNGRPPAGTELEERPSGAPLRGGNRAIGFLRASWAELQRVQWPDRRQVFQATAVVLGFVAIAGAYLGLADYVAKEIVEFIL